MRSAVLVPTHKQKEAQGSSGYTAHSGSSSRDQKLGGSLLGTSVASRYETIALPARCFPMKQASSQSVPVLIVEDDHLVRMDTASFLEGEGFAVYEADDAAAAIRSLELHEEIRFVSQT